MPNKLTIEYVRSAFETRGWVLGSTEYIKAHLPLKFICERGHNHHISWSSFNSGHGCIYCSGGLAPTIKYIRSRFEAKGWTLQSSEYTNAQSLLRFNCSKGHNHQISWTNFRKGVGCGACASNIKFEIEAVRSAFEGRGWKLRSSEYKNTNSLLKFTCNKGHDHQISWSEFRKGVNCAYCVGGIKLDIRYIKSAFNLKSWTLLSDTYVRSSMPLKFVCDKGHKHQMSWDNFKGGKGCIHCSKSGFNPLKSAVFYYIRIFKEDSLEPFYKVGITNRHVHDRLKQLKIEYTLINTISFSIGQEALDYEQDILNKFRSSKVPLDLAKRILPISGYTELFDCDILNADAELLKIS